MMENSKLLEKMMNKTIELYLLTKKDRLLYGDSYVEFGERSMEVIPPKDITIQYNSKGILNKINKTERRR